MDDIHDMETTKKAEAVINKLGLPRPGRPAEDVGDLTWPKSVGDLESDKLAEHMTWWVGWAVYARYHLARAETNAEALKADHKIRVDDYLAKQGSTYKTVAEAKAVVANKPDMTRLQVKIQAADAIKRQVRSLLEGYEAKYTLISREISRRKADMDD